MDPAALFQSVSDESRLRLLRLLHRHELNVQELVRITGLSQPRVSKHLAVLRDHGWLEQRREGTWSWYRAVEPADFTAGAALFAQILAAADNVAEAAHDDGLLEAALSDRRRKSHDFFAGIADRWDEIRSGFEHPDLQVGTVGALVDPQLRILDIGTGTGAMLPVFAGAAGGVTALDNSQAMLVRAQARCRADGLEGVDFCAADVAHLPLTDAGYDACHCAMVLHHVPDPAAAMREMARVVRPGGRVMVTAFCSHDLAWMRDELAHHWLGFSRDEIAGLFTQAGLRFDRWLVRGPGTGAPVPASGNGPDGRPVAWPDVFLAVGTRTSGAASD